MKYRIISPTLDKSKIIETEKDILELISQSTNGFIILKNGDVVGIDLLKKCFIEVDKSKKNELNKMAGHFR